MCALLNAIFLLPQTPAESSLLEPLPSPEPLHPALQSQPVPPLASSSPPDSPTLISPPNPRSQSPVMGHGLQSSAAVNDKCPASSQSSAPHQPPRTNSGSGLPQPPSSPLPLTPVIHTNPHRRVRRAFSSADRWSVDF